MTFDDVKATYSSSINDEYDEFVVTLRRSDRMSCAIQYTPGNNTGVYWDNNCLSNYEFAKMPIKCVL